MPESLNDLLIRLDVCQSAKDWAKTQPDLATAWQNCRRADWMIWLLKRMGYKDPKNYRLIACACVRDTPLTDGRKVWDLLTDERSRTGVEVSERFANGEVTEQEMDAARAAAGAAGVAAWATAGNAAWAAAWAAARDAAQSDIIRRYLPVCPV